MTRAKFRAFKCRHDVHRPTPSELGCISECRDCGHVVDRVYDKTLGISLRWVKQWDVQLDPMPSFVRYVLPEFAGRINPDGSFTPK